VFTRLLVGLDGSPRADSAFEQAVVLAQRFGSTVVVAYVRERGGHGADGADGAAMLDRARERLVAAGLRAELVEREGEPDLELAELAKPADAVLVGRRGVTTKSDALGPTATSLIRIAERCVLVCGGLPSQMTSCALAFDGRETSRRALELAASFATVVGSTVHVIHAAEDRDAGLQVVGVAEAMLSMQRVPFVTHVEPGNPGEVVARVIQRTRCDALFAGAHLTHQHGRPSAVVVSHAEEILRHTDIPVVIQP
jgi:nucleotide-binding universal stress UspA family protein